MKKIFLLLFVIAATFSVSAQNKKNIVIKVDDAVSLNEAVATETQYLFPEFIEGVVFFKSGAPSRGKVNYNMLVKEVQFLSPADGSVLAVENQSGIDMVVANNRVLANSPKGIVELIYENESSEVILAVKRIVKQRDVQGADLGYGGRTYTGNADKLENMTFTYGITKQQTTHKMNTALDEVRIQSSKDFYLLKNNKYYTPSKKTFTKIFPAKKAEVEKYIDEQKIDFNDADDLKKLIDYCSLL